MEHCQTHSLTCFPQKEIISKFSIFDKNHRITPLKNFNYFAINKSTFLPPRMALYQIEHYQNTFSRLVFLRKKIILNFHFFNENQCVNHFGEDPFFDHLQIYIFSSKMDYLLLSTSLNTFSIPNMFKKEQICDKNHGLTLWKISTFSSLTNRYFYCLKWRFFTQ